MGCLNCPRMGVGRGLVRCGELLVGGVVGSAMLVEAERIYRYGRRSRSVVR